MDDVNAPEIVRARAPTKLAARRQSDAGAHTVDNEGTAVDNAIRRVELWERRSEAVIATVARLTFVVIAVVDPEPLKLVPLGLVSLPYRRMHFVLDCIRAWRAAPPNRGRS